MVVRYENKKIFNGGPVGVFFVTTTSRKPKSPIRNSNRLREILDLAHDEFTENCDDDLHRSGSPERRTRRTDWSLKRRKSETPVVSKNKLCPKTEEDTEEYLIKLSNSLSGRQQNESFYRFTWSDPRQSLEDIVAKIGPEQTYDCLLIVMEGDKIPLRLYSKVIDRRLALMGMTVIAVFPATIDLLPKIVEYVCMQFRLYVVTVALQNQILKTLSVSNRLLSGTWEEHKNIPLEDAMQLIKQTFASYSVEIPEVEIITEEAATPNVFDLDPASSNPSTSLADPVMEQLASGIALPDSESVKPDPEILLLNSQTAPPAPEILQPKSFSATGDISNTSATIYQEIVIIDDDLSDISTDSDPDWDELKSSANKELPVTGNTVTQAKGTTKALPSKDQLTSQTEAPTPVASAAITARLFHRLAGGCPLTLEEVDVVISHMINMRQRLSSGALLPINRIVRDIHLAHTSRRSDDDRATPPRRRNDDFDRPSQHKSETHESKRRHRFNDYGRSSRRSNEDFEVLSRRRNNSHDSPPRRKTDHGRSPKRSNQDIDRPIRNRDGDSVGSSRRSNEDTDRPSRNRDGESVRSSRRSNEGSDRPSRNRDDDSVRSSRRSIENINRSSINRDVDSVRSSRRTIEDIDHPSKNRDGDSSRSCKRNVDKFGRDIILRASYSNDDSTIPASGETGDSVCTSKLGTTNLPHLVGGLALQTPAPSLAAGSNCSGTQNVPVHLVHSPTLRPSAVSTILPHVLDNPTIQKALHNLSQSPDFFKRLGVAATATSESSLMPRAALTSSFDVGVGVRCRESADYMSEAERVFIEERRIQMLRQLHEKELEMTALLRQRAEFVNRMMMVNRERQGQVDRVGEQQSLPVMSDYQEPPSKNPRFDESELRNEFGPRGYQQHSDVNRKWFE